MAAYPSYGILLDSEMEWESSWRDDIAESGSLHSRQLRSTNYVRFLLVHHMTTAEWRSLLTTFQAGPRDTYTLTYHTESPSVTYSVTFLEPPRVIANHGGSRHTVQVTLRGVQD